MARRTTAPHGAQVGGQAPEGSTARHGHAATGLATASHPGALGAGHPAHAGAPAPHGDGEEHPPSRGGPVRRVRRFGAGGRWWVWLGRAVLWALIIVIVVNGGRAAFVSFTEGTAPAQPQAEPGGRFPSTAASAYAQEFAGVYLNYDEAAADTRASRLAAYLPEGADPQLGWNGAGRLRLEEVYVAGVDVRDAKHGMVMLAVRVNGAWMRLAVPVYASGDSMVISGQPALLPVPPKASLPAPPAGTEEIDAPATSELERQLPGFFQAYAASDNADLTRYLEQGTTVTGLDGAVRFVALQDLVVPPGGNTRQITATVVWRIATAGTTRVPPGELTQTYELAVTKQDGNWYVKDIQGSTEPTGQ
ncbi:MAG: conjugal transfer protein [Streptosporangiales bacterium]|nr:conjugal transfer protein [Streptosporangiales bacterium]